MSTTLNEAFTILHWTMVIYGADSQYGPISSKSWAPMPEPLRRAQVCLSLRSLRSFAAIKVFPDRRPQEQSSARQWIICVDLQLARHSLARRLVHPRFVFASRPLAVLFHVCNPTVSALSPASSEPSPVLLTTEPTWEA